jgi:hypothetical protein
MFFLEAHIVLERKIGILASPLAMSLGWVVKIIECRFSRPLSIGLLFSG